MRRYSPDRPRSNKLGIMGHARGMKAYSNTARRASKTFYFPNPLNIYALARRTGWHYDKPNQDNHYTTFIVLRIIDSYMGINPITYYEC